MSRLAVLLVATFLLSLRAAAEPTLTITCEDPQGLRYDYGPPPGSWYSDEVNPRLQKSDDGFTDVKPLFVLDSRDTSLLTVIFGSTQLVPRYAPTRAREARLVQSTADYLVAIEVGEESIWVHTFYPKLGVAFFSRNILQHPRPHLGNAVAALYFAKCTFTPGSTE